MRHFGMTIEVSIESLLGCLQDEVAIRALVDMARNSCSHARRETALQILANQTNSLSAGHASPLIPLPLNPQHGVLQCREHPRPSGRPVESAIYEKGTVGLGVLELVRDWNFFTNDFVSA